jgi:hypothetical protein
MSVLTMTDKTERSVITDSAEKTGRPKSFSRRALIKGGVTAMPAILTLQSGAALARSSNLIGEAPAGFSDPEATHTICVDKSSVTDLGNGIYDLGPSRYADATLIDNKHQYYITKSEDYPISARAMCEKGSAANNGPFYWKDRNYSPPWRSAELKQGFVVSAGAYSSFAFDVSKSFIE